jgi:hypothetical protein
MTLIAHPHSVPDALVATLPAGTSADPTPVGTAAARSVERAPADASADRLGLGCRSCAAGRYAPGPGAGHVTCDACGHATIRRGRITGPRRRS